MRDQDNSVLAAFRREPEQTAFLFKLSAVTAIGLAAWDVMAGWVLPAIAVTAVIVLAAMAYGAALTFIVARIMGGSREWVSSSQLAAEKLAVSGGERYRSGRGAELEALRKRPDELPPVEDDDASAPAELHPAAPSPMDTIVFNESYFMLRLQEQVKEARRQGREMCVAAVHVTLHGSEMTPEISQSIAYDMARIASSQSRLMSQPLALSDSEFVFSLPQVGPNETKQFVREVMRAFGDYWCYFGIAAFPRHATDAVTLVERARAACETSLQSGKRGQVEYSAA